jgi:hypothetical protein
VCQNDRPSGCSWTCWWSCTVQYCTVLYGVVLGWKSDAKGGSKYSTFTKRQGSAIQRTAPSHAAMLFQVWAGMAATGVRATRATRAARARAKRGQGVGYGLGWVDGGFLGVALGTIGSRNVRVARWTLSRRRKRSTTSASTCTADAMTRIASLLCHAGCC